MARTFVLPDLGEGLIEAEIRAVLVREGDVVKEDSPLLEVETDKAQVEIPSPFAGRVEKIHVEPGQTVKVGQPLVSFADGGGAAPPARSAPTAVATVAPANQSAVAPRPDGGPIAAAPSTRRLARELGVELQAVRGTGQGDASPTTTCARALASPQALPRRPRAPPLPRARPSRSPPSASSRRPCPGSSSGGPSSASPFRISGGRSPSAWRCRPR